MRYLIVLLFCCIFNILRSQTFTRIYDFGNEALENHFSGLKIIDHFIFINSKNFCRKESNGNYECSVFTKLNLQGDIIMQVVNDTLSPGLNHSFDVINDKIILTGVKSTPGNWFGRESEFYIYNKDLSDLNQFSISGYENRVDANFNVVSIDTSVFFIRTYQNPNPAEAEIFKLDNDFKTIWKKSFHAGSSALECIDIQKTNDGNLAFRLKVAHSAGVSPYPLGFKIVKINQDGDTLKSFFHEDDINEPTTFLVSNDGHYYFNSERDPLKYNNLIKGRLNKLNPSMDAIVWSLVLPNNQLTDGRIYRVEDIIEARNGDIVICGRVRDNEIPGGNIHSVFNGFIMRLTPDANVLWLKIYKNPQNLLDKNDFGRHRVSVLKTIQEVENGNFIAAGEVYYNQIQRTQINQQENEVSHLWLMTTDSMGCVEGYPCEERTRLYNTSNHNLVNSNVYWTEKENDFLSGEIKNKRYQFSNDSTYLGTNQYRELLISNQEFGDEYVGLSRFFREENNRIFEYNNNEEILMYDFNINAKDTFTLFNPDLGVLFPLFVNQILDPISLLNGEKRRLIELNCTENKPRLSNWIEGIGSTLGFLSVYNTCAFDINNNLQCFYRNDTLLYMNSASNTCWLVSTEESFHHTIRLLPNPSKDEIQITSDHTFDTVIIFNNIGQNIFECSYCNNLNVTDLKSGVYFIEILNKNISLGRRKFVKI